MQGIGALVNIILDPIFIFGLFGLPEMGITGAAIATVTGQILAMVLGAWIIHKKIPFIHLGLHHFHFSLETCRQIYSVGFPAIIMQSVASVMTLGMNMILMPYSELAISVYSVYAKLQQFIFMPVMGMNSALIAIVGYNYGAQKKQRIYQATRYSLIAAAVIMAVGTFLFQLAPQTLLGMFNASAEMLEIGIPALKTISLSFVFAGVSIVLCSIFQALDDGMLSLWVSLGRQLILVLPLAWLLSAWGGLNRLWLAFVISEAICMLFSTPCTAGSESARSMGLTLIWKLDQKTWKSEKTENKKLARSPGSEGIPSAQSRRPASFSLDKSIGLNENTRHSSAKHA